MGNYRRVISTDPSERNPSELIKQLRKQIGVQLELLTKMEHSIGHGQPGQTERLNEKSGYGVEDYMPDYILDDDGYIVDVLPGSVRITPREQRTGERRQSNTG